MVSYSQTKFTHYFFHCLKFNHYLVTVILKSKLSIMVSAPIEVSGELFFITLKHCTSHLLKSINVFFIVLDLVESLTAMPRAPSLLNRPRPRGVRQLLMFQQWTTPSSSQGAASLLSKPV